MKYSCILFISLLLTSCQFFETEKISKETFYEEEVKTIDWKEVDQYPVFKECETISEKGLQKSCFENTLSSHLYHTLQSKKAVTLHPLNDTLRLEFSVSKDAELTVTDIEIDSTVTKELPLLKDWLLQSIDSIPLVAPAYKRGIPVRTTFSFPIILRSQDL